MQVINFDSENVRAVESLFIEIGIASNLEKFLASHLLNVLQKQQVGVEIISIELLKIHDCSGKGFQSDGSQIVEINIICIPIDVRVGLSGTCRMTTLDLYVQIIADNSKQESRIETNVFVKSQLHTKQVESRSDAVAEAPSPLPAHRTGRSTSGGQAWFLVFSWEGETKNQV